MNFPTLKEVPSNYTVTPEKRRALRNLEEIISGLVNSIEFEDLLHEYGWRSEWGHCAVAAEAMQILAWKLIGVYLVTRNYREGSFSHWFLQEPQGGDIYDPTKFQFGGDDISHMYENSVARGFQSRLREAPYTRSEGAKTLVEVVEGNLKDYLG